MARSPNPSGRGAERRHGAPSHERLTTPEAVLADGELTPPRKLNVLTGWDDSHGTARAKGHGRVAGAADLGFPGPAPYPPEVQRGVIELYRLHRDDLPRPEDGPWSALPDPSATQTRKAANADPD